MGEVPPDDGDVEVVATITLLAVTMPKTDFLIVHCFGCPVTVFKPKTKPNLAFFINPDLTVPLLNCLLAENVAMKLVENNNDVEDFKMPYKHYGKADLENMQAKYQKLNNLSKGLNVRFNGTNITSG